jgi:hypothetical protein
MSSTLGRARKQATSAPDSRITQTGSSDRWFDAVIDELRPIYRHKFAMNLALKADVTERIARLWMQGKRQPGGAALVELLCSDIGDVVHLALTRGVTHPWRRNLGRQHQIISIKRETKDAARRLAALEEDIL